jgi:hypothetical protein
MKFLISFALILAACVQCRTEQNHFDNRPLCRETTQDSYKWQHGHCAGCVLYALDDQCICPDIEFDSAQKKRWSALDGLLAAR